MGKQNGKVAPSNDEMKIYTWEQASKKTGYIVTVGVLDDAAKAFGEFENADEDYQKCKWHKDVDSALKYIHDNMSGDFAYNKLMKESRIAYTPEGFDAEDMEKRGLVTVEEMNAARNKDPEIFPYHAYLSIGYGDYADIGVNKENIYGVHGHRATEPLEHKHGTFSYENIAYYPGDDELKCGDGYEATFESVEDARVWAKEIFDSQCYGGSKIEIIEHIKCDTPDGNSTKYITTEVSFDDLKEKYSDKHKSKVSQAEAVSAEIPTDSNEGMGTTPAGDD